MVLDSDLSSKIYDSERCSIWIFSRRFPDWSQTEVPQLRAFWRIENNEVPKQGFQDVTTNNEILLEYNMISRPKQKPGKTTSVTPLCRMCWNHRVGASRSSSGGLVQHRNSKYQTVWFKHLTCEVNYSSVIDPRLSWTSLPWSPWL